MAPPRKPLVAPRRPPAASPAPPVDAAAEAFIRGGAGHLVGVSETPAAPPRARAPAGSATMFERKRGGPKRRMNVYFRPETFEALSAHCAATGDDLSRVIDEAVGHHLAALACR